MPAFKRANGKWYYRIVVALPDGSKRRISGAPMIDTRKHAEDAERAHIERLLNPAIEVKPLAPSFFDFAYRWLNTYPVSVGARPSTIKNYKYHLHQYLLS